MAEDTETLHGTVRPRPIAVRVRLTADRRPRIEDLLLRIAEDHPTTLLLIVADRPRTAEVHRLIAQRRRPIMAAAPAVAAITGEAVVVPTMLVAAAVAVAPTAEAVVAGMPRPAVAMADIGKRG